MATTYKAIATVTVGSGGASTIDFTSIPSTYTDLLVKLSSRYDNISLNYTYVGFNGSTTNFTYRSLEGDGSTVVSANGSTGGIGVTTPSGYTANTFSNIEFYIPNYAGSNNKSYSSDSVAENNGTTTYADFIAGLWSQTSAINQVTIYATTGKFAQYTTAYLYGIKSS